MADVVAPATEQSTTPVGGGAPAPVVEAAPSSSAPATNGSDGWNGEVDHLEKRPWWNKLDESERKDLRDGYSKKATNLEKGYNQKFQTIAEERKAWAAKEATYQKEVKELREEALFVKDIFGQGSPEAKDVDARLAALKKEMEDKHAPTLKELEELRGYKTSREKVEQEAHAARVEAEEKRLSEAYGDILSDPKAAEMFANLVGAEVEDEDAAQLVRNKFKIATPRLPAAARLASRGDSPAVQDRLPRGQLSSRDLIERAVEQSARQIGAR